MPVDAFVMATTRRRRGRRAATPEGAVRGYPSPPKIPERVMVTRIRPQRNNRHVVVMRDRVWLQYRSMHNRRFARRAVAAALALSVGVAPFLSASNARADEITDLQTRADQISSQISDLQAQVERDTAAVERATYQASVIDEKIDKATAQLAAAKRHEASSRKDLADYALNAYVNGGSGSVDLAVLLDTKGDEIGPRQGYTSTAVGDRQELVDQLQASQRITADRADTLATERKNAAAVAEQAKDKKASAEAAQRELESVQSQVKGKLATLVAEKQAAEERAREARAREAAQAAQRRAAAEAATHAAASQAAAPNVTAPVQTESAPAPGPVQSTAPAPTAPVPSSGRGGAAVAAAASQLGTPYVWGGSSPGGFDCSGLTMWAWAQAGVSLPRVTYSQRSAGQVVPLSQIQPGDLVFYNGFSHVGLYAGGGSIIHAPHTGDVVKYASLYMSNPILVVRPG